MSDKKKEGYKEPDPGKDVFNMLVVVMIILLVLGIGESILNPHL